MMETLKRYPMLLAGGGFILAILASMSFYTVPETKQAVVLRLGKPIEFGSIDNLPVDLVIALLSPVATGAMHLQALAHISRLTRDEKTLAKIKGADDPDAIYALVTAELDRDAA